MKKLTKAQKDAAEILGKALTLCNSLDLPVVAWSEEGGPKGEELNGTALLHTEESWYGTPFVTVGLANHRFHVGHSEGKEI